MQDHLNDLFEQTKITGDWNELYEGLQVACNNISSNLYIPLCKSEDILHDVILDSLPKLKSIENVGYILQAIKWKCLDVIKYDKNKRKSDGGNYRSGHFEESC